MYVVRIWEGLGNQMFQYAFARSLHHRTGQDVYLDTKRVYKESFAVESKHIERLYSLGHFNITLPTIDVGQDKRFDFLKQKTWLEKCIFYLSKRGKWGVRFLQDADAVYHKEFFSEAGDYYAFGWFQQEAYFADIRDVLLKEFTLQEEIVLPHELQDVLENKNTVAVHIRRGDYLRCGMSCNEYYYMKAIDKVRNEMKNPVFLVFTDDVEWVKRHIKTETTMYYVSESCKLRDYEELILMSRCRHQIISNSTFSWWAAWLNQNPDKRVISPAKWFSIQANIVPREWTII